MTDTGNEALRAAFERWARGENSPLPTGNYTESEWERLYLAYARGAADGRAEENEACAKLIEVWPDLTFVQARIARAIRARKEQGGGK